MEKAYRTVEDVAPVAKQALESLDRKGGETALRLAGEEFAWRMLATMKAAAVAFEALQQAEMVYRIHCR